jgi:hypothetical protein
MPPAIQIRVNGINLLHVDFLIIWDVKSYKNKQHLSSDALSYLFNNLLIFSVTCMYFNSMTYYSI